MIVTSEIVEQEPAPQKNQKKVLFKTYMIVWYVCWLIELLLAFRFVLKLFAANPNSGFTIFIYSLSRPLMAPFIGIFNTPAQAGYVFEASTLVAMVVYAVIAYVITEFLRVAKPVSAAEAEKEM